MASLEEQLERARELSEARPAEAVALLRAVCLPPAGAPAEGGDAALKAREAAVHALAALLAKQGEAAALRALLSELRPLFAAIPKAKPAKLVRAVIDAVATVPNTTALQARGHAPARRAAGRRGACADACAPRRTQVELCKEQVEWTRQEKRTFLRHRVELRLAALYLETLDYAAALALVSECAPRLASPKVCACAAARASRAPLRRRRLLTEVKRLDDKLLLVDIHLIESKGTRSAAQSAPRLLALVTSRAAAPPAPRHLAC